MHRVDGSRPRWIFPILAALAFASFWLGASQAFACACCTDPGYRNVRGVPFVGRKRTEIKWVRFANSAQLFVTAGGLETVKGITTPSEHYKIKANWDKSRVVFDLRDAQGGSGTLSLAIPRKLSVFEVDPRRGPDQGSGPVLYKEWKLTGKAAGTGVFSAASSPGHLLTLIVQGRGNACTSAADFAHWTLVMQGPKANYHLFGDLVRP
jgi:hypothetical protein